ncbi:hypothetical protein LCGC14_0515030 [marine sediment metagenome]|uniref:Uncharacterized protein n=1 Tax=marine sediment metagenome TaxID=412755 RepID=A0A0F9SIJ3_9ZZZZ
MVRGNNLVKIRPSKEFNDIINFIRAKCILEGKIPPSKARITQAIAKKINKEELLRNEFIRF